MTNGFVLCRLENFSKGEFRMEQKIRVGIVGYGNLGRGVELALGQQPDMELAAVFTRRNPAQLQIHSKDLRFKILS